MIFPISDAPNPKGSTPFVTWLLMAANIAVYAFISLPLGNAPASASDPMLDAYMREIADMVSSRRELELLVSQLSQYDLFVFRWGFRPADADLAPLFTSMFLHGGFMHLAGNMLFLWIYGDNVEHQLGHGRYLVAYLLTGVAATVFHGMSFPESGLPVVGASGAISGVLGFYFIFFPRNTVRVLWLLPPFIFQTFDVRARLVLGFYLIADNILPYFFSASASGVAHGAHIGGFLAGLGAAWVLSRRPERQRPTEFAQAPVSHGRGSADSLERALDAGDMEGAARAYFAIPASHSRRLLAGEDSIRMADWLSENDHDDAAVVVLRRHVRDFSSGPSLTGAALRLGRLLLKRGQATAAYQYFLMVLDLDQSGPDAGAAREAIRRIEALQKRMPAPRPA